MKFEHYHKRLEESREFKNFKQEHKKSYLAAGFFILDFETGRNIHQIDYSLPDGKIATFLLDEGVNLKISGQAIKKKLPELKKESNIDLDALKGIVEDEMKNRTVTEKVKKIIAVLHIMDDKIIWNLQCILDGLSLLNVHVDDSDGSILKFEKHSLLELIKPIAGMQMPQSPQMQQPQPEVIINAKSLEKLKEQIKAAQEKVEEKKKEKKEVKKKGKK